MSARRASVVGGGSLMRRILIFILALPVVIAGLWRFVKEMT